MAGEDCSRRPVCPSEAWPGEVSIEQRNATYEHRMIVTLPTQVCNGNLVEPEPAECGAGTLNEDCVQVCDGDVRVVSISASVPKSYFSGKEWRVVKPLVDKCTDSIIEDLREFAEEGVTPLFGLEVSTVLREVRSGRAEAILKRSPARDTRGDHRPSPFHLGRGWHALAAWQTQIA